MERKEFQIAIIGVIIGLYGIFYTRLPSSINISGKDISLEIIWFGWLIFNIISGIALFVLLYSTKTGDPFRNRKMEEYYERLFNFSLTFIGATILLFFVINLNMLVNRIFNPANNTFMGTVIIVIIAYICIKLVDYIKTTYF